MPNLWRKCSLQTRFLITCGAFSLLMAGALGRPILSENSRTDLLVLCLMMMVSFFWMLRFWVIKPLKKSMGLVEKKTNDDQADFHRLHGSLSVMANQLLNLKEDANKHKAFLNALPTPVVAVDKEFNILFMNQWGLDFLNREDGVVGEKCYDLFKTPHCHKPECCADKAIKNDQVCSAETVYDSKGACLPMRYYCGPLRDESGEVMGSLIYLMDIKEQKSFQSGVKNSVAVLGNVVEDVTSALDEMSAKSDNISEQANSVAVAAEEMSVTMKNLSQEAESSQGNIAEVAQAVEEMTLTVAEIAKNSEQARVVAGDAVANVEGASDRVNRLGHDAHEIGQVINTIVEISEQTKLLALNATIEAARAGEAGKGFSVVANEVKELAKQTSAAAEDIHDKISAIQASTDDTVEEISGINDVIYKVNESVASIATAVEEQSITTRNIAGSIGHASDNITNMAQNVIQSAETANEVTRNISMVNCHIGDVNNASSDLTMTGEILKETGAELSNLVSEFDGD